jgi:hypothetical protein
MTKQKKRVRRQRERLLSVAVAWSVAVIFGVGLALFLALFLTPNSALRNYWDLTHYNAVTASNPLYQQFANGMELEEKLLVTPLSLFCGGAVLGLLASPREGRRRLLLTSLGLAVGVLVVSLGFTWSVVIYQSISFAREWQIKPMTPIATHAYILAQTAWILGWIAVCVLGTFAALLWRSFRRKITVQSAAPAAPVPGS